MQRMFCSFVLLLLSSALSTVHAQVTIILRRPFASNLIELSCLRNNIPSNFPTYHVRDNMDRATQLQEPLDDEGTVLFELTPQTEGRYFCTVNNVNSEELTLVAFPERVPSIAAITTAAVQSGQSVILQCDFELGRLSTRYSFRWLRSSIGSFSTIVSSNPNTNIDPSKYQLLADQSLQIISAELADAEDTFTCLVSVSNPMGNTFDGTGRTVSLEVFDAVQITRGIANEDQTVMEGREAVFVCEANGVPAPSITWLSDGVEIPMFGVYQITSTTEGNVITSTLTVSPARAENNAIIMCQATNSPRTRDNTFNVSSSAILTVLSNNIEGLLLTTSQRPDFLVFIVFTLPAEILQPVAIDVEYIDEDTGAISRDELTDPGFSNTREVHYMIPQDNLPSFTAFSVRIRLEVDDTRGPSTEQSNAISVARENSTPTSVVTSSSSNKTNFTIIGAVGAVLLIAILGLIVGAICFIVYTCIHHHSHTKEVAIRHGKRIASDAGGGEEELLLPDSEFRETWQAYWDKIPGRWEAIAAEDMTGLPWEAFGVMELEVAVKVDMGSKQDNTSEGAREGRHDNRRMAVDSGDSDSSDHYARTNSSVVTGGDGTVYIEGQQLEYLEMTYHEVHNCNGPETHLMLNESHA